MRVLSASQRSAAIHQFPSTNYDLIIIGGGITGAGIALDAATRGLKVALVEKNDFAYGTSSRSTKLIHGGLRYLKQLEFGLVKEVGSERAVVHRLAPHLVVPEKMLLPLYERRGFGSLLTSLGLKLYDWLAGVKPEDQRKMLTRSQTLAQEPLLKQDDVKGGAIYAEYRTDDARLTTEIVKTAARFGADIVNYCKVTGFQYADGRLTGLELHDEIGGTTTEIHGNAVVSAAGPWVDHLREMDQSKQGKYLHLTKGIHLVLPTGKLPVRQAIYFDVEDGRMIFAIPRGRITYVGTTDTNYSGDVDAVRATKVDAEYLVNAVNRTFPSANIGLSDIESSWAGLRPLIHEEGKSASELSRKDEIFQSHSGLISIAGGKLTGYRKMAERVVDLVIETHFKQREFRPCTTDRIALVTPGFDNYSLVEPYRRKVAAKLGGDLQTADYLVGNYGMQTDTIIDGVHAEEDDKLVRSEVRFAIEHEMAMKPVDFIVRRTGILYFYKHRISSILETVMSEFGRRFNWSREMLDVERNKVLEAARDVVNFV